MTMTKRNTKLKTIFLMLCLGASTIAAAQKDNAKKNNDIVKNSVYAELGKVPASDAAKHNPLEKDPNAIAAGEKSSKPALRRVSRCQRRWRPQRSQPARRASAAGDSRCIVLGADERRSPPRYACVVKIAGTATLADRHVM